MRYCRLALATLVLVVSFITHQAQTPEAAKRYFQQGVKNLAEGNLAVAFEDYSRAIEISSRLVAPTSTTSALACSSTGADEHGHRASVGRVTVEVDCTQ